MCKESADDKLGNCDCDGSCCDCDCGCGDLHGHDDGGCIVCGGACCDDEGLDDADMPVCREELLLATLYRLFRLSQTQGSLMMEAHFEMPHDSSILSVAELTAGELEFLCDSLRMSLHANDMETQRRAMEVDLASRWVVLPWKRARFRAIIEGVCAYVAGNPPQFAAEVARRSLPWYMRPSYAEMEQVIVNLPYDIAQADGPSQAELLAAMDEILGRNKRVEGDDDATCR